MLTHLWVCLKFNPSARVLGAPLSPPGRSASAAAFLASLLHQAPPVWSRLAKIHLGALEGIWVPSHLHRQRLQAATSIWRQRMTSWLKSKAVLPKLAHTWPMCHAWYVSKTSQDCRVYSCCCMSLTCMQNPPCWLPSSQGDKQVIFASAVAELTHAAAAHTEYPVQQRLGSVCKARGSLC